jgi:hypothetical protein
LTSAEAAVSAAAPAWAYHNSDHTVVYPEIQRELCPGLFGETVPSGADADIFAWRQLAWDNAQRLLTAPTPKARDRIASQVRRHAGDKAREILWWNR